MSSQRHFGQEVKVAHGNSTRSPAGGVNSLETATARKDLVQQNAEHLCRLGDAACLPGFLQCG